jgi:hypothetical protein
LNRRNSAKLEGTIRLAPGVDSIGIPIFMAGNMMYVPEMDGDFRITKFLDFYNEDNFLVHRDVPDGYRSRRFLIGDPTPLPFWFNRALYFIEGDAEKEVLEQRFGIAARTDPVLSDMGRILDDARTGKINDRIAERKAEDLASGFDDVFLEAPTRTRYWLSRYRVALENARKFTSPPHPIDVRLRNASREWLQRFATKTEFPMVAALLGEASQGIYSTTQIRDIIFAYLSHRLSTNLIGELGRLNSDQTLKAMFPEGIYFHFLKSGWPWVPFGFERPDFIDIMKSRIADCSVKRSWVPASRLSQLLFGGRDAPNEVDDMVMMYIRKEIEELRKWINAAEDERDQVSVYRNDAEFIRCSINIVRTFDRVKDLSGITHGSERLSGKMVPGRFGLYEEQVATYRKLVENKYD